MDIKIREAEEKDLENLISLYSQPDMDNGQTISLENAKQIFAKFRTYPFYKVYAAISDEKIVGTFELLVMDNLAHKGSLSAVVEDVVVSDKYQGKGIGKEMMIFAMKVCRKMGCYKLSLSSNLKREFTHKFYESLGFNKHGYSFYIDL